MCNTKINVVSRPLHSNEPDLLKGYENDVLLIVDLNGEKVSEINPPKDGWTHDLLENVSILSETYSLGCDFYLGKNWIGSTEI